MLKQTELGSTLFKATQEQILAVARKMSSSNVIYLPCKYGSNRVSHFLATETI